MRFADRFVKAGVAAACALLAGLACAQAAGEKPAGDGGDKPAVTVKKKPTDLFGMNVKKPADADVPTRPTVITADQIDLDHKEGFILFDRNVLVDDAQFVMRADQLIVFTEGTNDVKQLMAKGNVSITNELQKASATCDQAVYDKKENHMVMTAEGDRVVRVVMEGDSKNTVEGAQVLAWIDDEGFWHAKVLKRSKVVLEGGLGGARGGAKDEKDKKAAEDGNAPAP